MAGCDAEFRYSSLSGLGRNVFRGHNDYADSHFVAKHGGNLRVLSSMLTHRAAWPAGLRASTRNDLEVSWHTLLADRYTGEHTGDSPLCFSPDS